MSGHRLLRQSRIHPVERFFVLFFAFLFGLGVLLTGLWLLRGLWTVTDVSTWMWEYLTITALFAVVFATGLLSRLASEVPRKVGLGWGNIVGLSIVAAFAVGGIALLAEGLVGSGGFFDTLIGACMLPVPIVGGLGALNWWAGGRSSSPSMGEAQMGVHEFDSREPYSETAFANGRVFRGSDASFQAETWRGYQEREDRNRRSEDR